MRNKILIIPSLVFVIFLLVLICGGRSGGVVDKIDLKTHETEYTIDKIDESKLPEIANNYVGYVSYVRGVADSTGYGSVNVVGNYISVNGRNISVVDVASTAVNAGDHVNKYGARFYYGHNTGAVFGGLVNYGVGSSFSIYYGGVMHNYRVAKVMIFEKNVSNGHLELNGSGNYMRSVADARSGGVQYDVSLMTCYGTSYGDGDASHRLVLYANEI
ncbi:MAG: hypothetical protein Q4A70_03420 [Candidatus Saccharibacteria bacterium]|nr:hypothetical protein [Candidatus Saccharibacteria bacterium]